ncbi:hypothetical protein RugamoR57_03700 [Duganella caerulea]|uniref:hypothetical protein n=1 Tax=Duganella caerulea TaxID=2885762 RepID=UPI0030EAA2F8
MSAAGRGVAGEVSLDRRRLPATVADVGWAAEERAVLLLLVALLVVLLAVLVAALLALPGLALRRFLGI